MPWLTTGAKRRCGAGSSEQGVSGPAGRVASVCPPVRRVESRADLGGAPSTVLTQAAPTSVNVSCSAPGAGCHCRLLGMALLCSSGRAHQASFFPRAKVSPAPRCPLSGPTSWPSSRTSPIGPRCTSASGSCWARTGSTGEPLLPPASGQGPSGDAAPRLRHPALHLPSSFLRPCSPRPALAAPLPQAGGPSVGIASWGTEHAGPVSLLHVTTRAGSQARSSPFSPGRADSCHHTVPRGHQMTLCGWQVRGWAGPAWGRERSGRTLIWALHQEPLGVWWPNGVLPGSLSPSAPAVLSVCAQKRTAARSWGSLLPQV